jgi:hypothetical protein
MNTYKWRINALDCNVNKNDLENVVYSIHWSYLAEDENGNVASMIGVESVGEPDPSNFQSFDTLTQEIVEGWLEASMGTERIDEMKANLDKQIEEIVTPKTVTLQLPTTEVAPETEIV